VADEISKIHISPDSAFMVEAPITNPESDLFGFCNSVQIATRFFQECPRPIQFAVYGRSGSGRTSFIRLMENSLNKREEIIQLHFSSRPFRNSTSLVRALLRRLEKTLQIEDPRFEEIKKVAAGAPAPDSNDFDRWVDATETLKADLNEIVVKSLKKLNKEILFIALDDLDLCNSRLKIQLIEFVAEFLGLESLILVITVDRKQLISDYLASHIFVAERQASLYLERIFPHSYTIPWIGEDQLIDYVMDALSKMDLLTIENKGSRRFRRMVEVYLRRAAVTPIKIVRELIKFSRMHSLAINESVLINHALFAIAIKSQFPEVYRFLLDKGERGHRDLRKVFDPDQDFSSNGFTVRYGRRLDRMLQDSALRDLFIAYDDGTTKWKLLLGYLTTAAFVPSPY
jgi:hypothetical protein